MEKGECGVCYNEYYGNELLSCSVCNELVCEYCFENMIKTGNCKCPFCRTPYKIPETEKTLEEVLGELLREDSFDSEGWSSWTTDDSYIIDTTTLPDTLIAESENDFIVYLESVYEYNDIRRIYRALGERQIVMEGGNYMYNNIFIQFDGNSYNDFLKILVMSDLAVSANQIVSEVRRYYNRIQNGYYDNVYPEILYYLQTRILNRIIGVEDLIQQSITLKNEHYHRVWSDRVYFQREILDNDDTI